jgi:Ca2+/Na+ antiporter
MRQMAYERRYNAIIDRMMEEERREAMALQKVILPVVALFVSTAFAAGLRPQFWSDSNVLGRIVLLTLFVVGLLHLVKRLQAGFERYTYSPIDIHDSILREMEEERRPYSRFTAVAFLIVGVVVSVAVGMLVSAAFAMSPGGFFRGLFPGILSPELILYPPIMVLLVDLMHSFATRFEK